MTGSTKPPELKELTAETVKITDLSRFPNMTGWFEPLLLGKLLLRVIVSDLFGQYADRRLIEAALDPATKEKHLKNAQLVRLAPDEEGAVWLDYVSDLGDGFDATYAVAYLLAQPKLRVGDDLLPRAHVLIMGGDEVYPTALRDDYKVKMRIPYEFALPDTKEKSEIPLFLLPGNHDWYDGLVNFLAIFCREKPTAIGRWRSNQRRSYFAAKLTENWWLWGIDIALVRDMDQPQADYFVAIAEGMPKGANIILCSAEPGWYKAEAKGGSYRTLSYAAGIAKNAGKAEGGRDLKIPLILSGDSHHYARYSGSGRQYITSGGGGAFLHGTLELKDKIEAEWLWDRRATLALQSCYPSKETSAGLLDGNRAFGTLNPELTTSIALLYLAFSFVLSLAWRWDVGLGIFALLFAGLYFYARYQEGHSLKALTLSAAHAAAHMAVVVAISWLALWTNRRFFGGFDWPWWLWLGALAVGALTAGRLLAGKIFGWNLLLTCRHFGMNHNDAFSAMKLDSHRHFLRIRISGDTLTIYPVKLEKVPARDEWRANSERTTEWSPSVFVPDPPMTAELIEEPLFIDASRAPTTADVKTPSELPPQS